MQYGAGGAFGERALLRKEPRAASVLLGAWGPALYIVLHRWSAGLSIAFAVFAFGADFKGRSEPSRARGLGADGRHGFQARAVEVHCHDQHAQFEGEFNPQGN